MNLHFLFALCSLHGSTAFATSFFIRPMEEVVAGTPNIVRGFVRSVRVEEQANERGIRTLVTVAELEVREVLKGPLAGSRIEVKRAGGEKNGVQLEIPGAPEFVENEETVLFLNEPLPDRSYEVRDMTLGKFGLDRSGGKELLTGGLLAYSHDHAAEDSPPAAGTPRREWSVADLRRLIEKQGNRTASRTPAPVSSPPPASPSPTASTAPSASSQAVSATASPDAGSAPGDSGTGLAGVLAVAAGLLLVIAILIRRKG